MQIFSERWELPLLKPCSKLPGSVVAFDRSKTKNTDDWIHFYIHDDRFERLWNSPSKYLDILKSCPGVISPDFSIYRDMPLSYQVWNTYRNRTLAYWMQQNGIDVIPNVRWGDERSYSFCFEGLPTFSTIAVGTHGCIKRKEDQIWFRKGFEKMLERISPRCIVIYGSVPFFLTQLNSNFRIKLLQFQNPFYLSLNQEVLKWAEV